MQDLSNENIIHLKRENIEYIQFRRLLEYPELVHCYTLKAYDFDIAGNDTYEEKKNIVDFNYTKLAKALEIQKETIIRPYQNHTDIVKIVGADSISAQSRNISIFPQEFTNVDGLLTNVKDIIFSLSYADCTPIYLYDPVKRVIGNIHSGWLGTLKGIGKVAVKKMIEGYDCNPSDIICCFGPHIHKCHFEVGEKVAKDFKKQYEKMKGIDDIIVYNGIVNGEEKYHINITKINENLMLEMGLLPENIIDSGICTVCNQEYMHSYRAHKENAGRNTAILGLRRKKVCVIQKN